MNGFIHWMWYYFLVGHGIKFGIVAFDLNIEVFKLIKPPEHIQANYVQSIGKLSKYLSFIYRDKSGLIEIWVMKERGDSYSWIKQVTVDLKWPFFRRGHEEDEDKETLSCHYSHKKQEQFYSIAFMNDVFLIICSASHGWFWYNVNSKILKYLGPEMTGWI